MSEEQVARIKEGARWLWAQGDYSRIAAALEPAALLLAGQCVRPGMRVLDLAAGNGNFALAAARKGGVVTACDVTPRMVELGRERSGAAGLDISWEEADAEAVPHADASFDLVATVFGAQFAPRPERVSSEMFRVVRPNGIVAMANYSPVGFLARLSDLIAGSSSTPGPSLPSPFLWGDPAEVGRRLHGLALTMEFEPRTLTLRFESYDQWRHDFADVNPPLQGLKQLLSAAAYEELMARCRDLVAELNTAREGRIELDSAYLVVIARRLATSPRG